MTKVNLELPSKAIILFTLFILFNINVGWTQCTNPVPTGDNAQDFCKIDQPTITDLVVSSGTIAWYDAPTGGEQFLTTHQLENGRIYYADDVTADGCSPSRFAVTVTVNGLEPTNVDVFVGKCAIEKATISQLSADGQNIEWYTESTGGTLLAPTHELENGQTYWVQQTYNSCTSSRLPTTVSLINQPAPTVPETQNFCVENAPTVAELDGSGPNIVWYTSETAADPLNDTDLLVNGNEYWAATVSFPCESTERTKTTIFIETPPKAGSNGTLLFCEQDSTVENLYDLLSGTREMTGTWSGPSALANGYLGTFDSAVNVEGVYTYTVSTGTGICPDASATVTVTIQQTPAPTVAASNQAFCDIDSATIADLVATGTSLVWFDTETSTTPLNLTDSLVDGEDYWASQTDPVTGCLSAVRAVVTTTITVVPPPSVGTTNQTFCSIDNPTIANLAISVGTLVWYDSETSTTPLATTDALIDGEDYWAAQTAANGCESPTRVVINATIIDVAPPTTTNPAQDFCAIDQPTVADLQVNEPSIVWYDSETGTTVVTDDTALVDGTSYWAALSANGCESPNRLEITATINDITAPTAAASQSFCEIDGATIADLAVTGNAVVWYATETDTTPLAATDALVEGEDYWAAQTDAVSGCLSSNRVAVTVTITVVPPPTVAETNQSFCAINTPTIADLAITGTTIVWYDSEVSTTALNTTDALIDGEDYWAAETATNGCISSNRVVINTTVIDTTAPTTASSTQEFCSIDQPTVANIQVNESSLVWYDSETGTTTVTIDTALVDGTTYWAALTANGCESTNRLAITVTLNTTAAPTTSAPAQTFCQIDNATLADLDINETSIVWYATETSTTALNSSDVVADSTTYWAAQVDTTTGCESTSRTAIAVTVISSTPPTTLESTQSFCLVNSPTVGDLQSNEENVFWYANETDTTPLAETEALVNGTQYYASFFNSADACEGPTRLMVTVVINDLAAPTTTSVTQTFCAVDTPTIASLDVNETSIQWYADETSTTPLDASTSLVDGTDYWAAQSDATVGCIGTSRLKISVVLTDPGTPTISAQGAEFCIIDEPTVGDLAARISGGSGTTTTLLDAPDGFELNASDMLQDGETYYAVSEDASGCVSVNTLAITVDLYQCDDYDVKFFDGFSPNGDGINDEFNILYIKELYPNFHVTFFNRYGAEVYSMNASTPSWNGRLHGDGALVPSGVYFYVVKFNKDGRKPHQGKLILNR